MRIANCRFAPQCSLRPMTADETTLSAVRVQLYLCRLHDCAAAVKTGPLPPETLFSENRIIQALHADCVQLMNGAAAGGGCEACAMARAIRLLAASDHPGPPLAFTAGGRGDDAEDLLARLSQDWSAAFRLHAGMADLPAGSQRRSFMEQAAASAKSVRDRLGGIAALEHLTELAAKSRKAYPHVHAEKLIFPPWLLSAPPVFPSTPDERPPGSGEGPRAAEDLADRHLDEWRGKRPGMTAAT